MNEVIRDKAAESYGRHTCDNADHGSFSVACKQLPASQHAQSENIPAWNTTRSKARMNVIPVVGLLGGL